MLLFATLLYRETKDRHGSLWFSIHRVSGSHLLLSSVSIVYMACDYSSLEIILLFFALHSKAKQCKFAIAIIAQCCCCCWLSFSALSPFYLHKIFFCNGRDSFLIFYRPQLYNLEALPFTYDQCVVIELADKLYNSITVCFCLSPWILIQINNVSQLLVPGIKPLTLG